MRLRKRTPISLLSGALLLGLSASVAALDLIPANCLEKLSDRTRDWAQCTQRFGRNDRRCQPATQEMDSYLRKCTRKGYSRTEINEAMRSGFRRSGEPQKAD